MSNQLIYLAQKYSGREAESLAEAMMYKWKLEKAGYRVFSPVINSAFEDWCKNKNFIVALDNIREGLLEDGFTLEPMLITFFEFIRSMYNNQAERSELDYLAWDLQFLGGHLIHDLDLFERRGGINDIFEPHIVVAFCPSCFANEYYNNPDKMDDESWEWASKGAKAEYDFCQRHHIECLLVDPLLEGKRERI